MYTLRNRIQLIGNLGAAPDVRITDTGRKVAHFSVATSEVYRNTNGEKVKETQWHRITAWGKLAEIAEKYLAKGREVALEGRLVNRSYTDKDGLKKNITEVLANELLLLGANPHNQPGAGHNSSQEE